MNRKYNQWLFGGLLAFVAIFGISSCTDDHFDVAGSNAGGGAGSNIWENLVATHKCDSFAMILQKTYVNKKSYGIPTTLTYDNLLKSDHTLTVWAPEDGTYNAKQWLDMLEEGKLEEVENQFVGNHVAQFNYNGSYPETKKIKMSNKKFATYNSVDSTFNGIKISGEYTNMPCFNGTLHLLEGASPFKPNMYEILSMYDDLSDFWSFVEKFDTIEFKASQSTVGTLVNGVAHYVDSVFDDYNMIYPRYSKTEDSCYATILPSNNAWDSVFAEAERYYNYLDGEMAYPYIDKTSEMIQLENRTLPGQRYASELDSLREYLPAKALINNMFFSMDEQHGFDVDSANVQTVGDFFEHCDSLVSTTYYKSNYRYHHHKPYCNLVAEHKYPIEASNGYAFITQGFHFRPTETWHYTIEIEGENSSNLRNLTGYGSTGIGSYQSVRVTSSTQNPNVLGTLSNSRYMEFTPQLATSKIKCVYALPNILSGVYDVYVVMVPENIGIADTLNTSPRYSMFGATIVPQFSTTAARVGTINKLTEVGATTVNNNATKCFKNDPNKVDTILLFENYKFPYAYVGMQNARPILRIESQYAARYKQATPYLRIDKIILKSKDEYDE